MTFKDPISVSSIRHVARLTGKAPTYVLQMLLAAGPPDPADDGPAGGRALAGIGCTKEYFMRLAYLGTFVWFFSDQVDLVFPASAGLTFWPWLRPDAASQEFAQ
jgi:hypothetical protein